MVKRVLLLALFVIVFNCLEHFAHKKTDGFSMQRIQFDAPISFGPAKQLPELDQPFHYLDCGNQCYAFISQDGLYVLKLFKYAQSPVPSLFTKIPLLNRFKPFRPHRLKKIAWKRQRDFCSYQIAHDSFSQETGLIDIHLTPTYHDYPTITLTDKLRCAHKLDLNMAPFVLQKRATPIYKQLRAWIAAGQQEEAKKGITSLLILLKKRINSNLQDDDVHFYSNFGFIGNEAIQIDPGHFTKGTSQDPALELKIITAPLVSWCKKNAPFLLSELPND